MRERGDEYRDKKLRHLVDVYLRGRKPYIYCSLLMDPECDHIRFTLSIPEVSQTLKKKGWKATGNSGF
jgi:hypothetical protein